MKVAILGAGGIACKMAEALKGLEKQGKPVEAYAIAARDLDRAQAFAGRWGFRKAYGSYEEMLSDDEVDLVYVATPHAFHYEHAKLSMSYGKAVLVEKAFTQNAAQAEELIAMAQEKQLLLAEAIWTRYMPSRQMILDLVESGIIGTVCSLQANLGYVIHHVPRMVRPELAGGSLLDLGVYPINFASMVLGTKVAKASGVCTKLDTGVDAQESITLLYEDGRAAFLYVTMFNMTDREGVINGDKGYIEVQNINNPEEIRIYDADRKLIKTVEVPEQINGYEYEVLACERALREGKIECEEMPHAEILRVMTLMDDLRAQFGVVYPNEV